MPFVPRSSVIRVCELRGTGARGHKPVKSHASTRPVSDSLSAVLSVGIGFGCLSASAVTVLKLHCCTNASVQVQRTKAWSPIGFW